MATEIRIPDRNFVVDIRRNEHRGTDDYIIECKLPGRESRTDEPGE
jgi:hypothetical protein